jgi:hypothetical protein
MVHNVPRMGHAGGFVHKRTGRYTCGQDANAPAEAPATAGRLGPVVGCPECAKMREYIRDHVHAFIDSAEIDRLMSYEEWCQLDTPNDPAVAQKSPQAGGSAEKEN